VARSLGYSISDLEVLPEGANLGLGCGAPLELLGLQPGESVLDLGCGAGMDILLAARQVGPEGRAIGVDMTPEMIQKARQNAEAAGLQQVEIREGRLENLPVSDSSVDAVTSNCVINLVPDKAMVFREIARVLKAGGRLAISDIILDGALPESLSQDILAYVGCVSGAMERKPYFRALEGAGLRQVEVLRDVDFLAQWGGSLPADLAQIVAREGLDPGSVNGLVRSVTYRAFKDQERE
jgi:SAM-dependent methyltransferase